MSIPYVEPDPNRIYHARDPRLPQFDFEWHVKTSKVYVIHVPGEFHDGQFVQSDAVLASGECIAEHVPTHAGFFGFVQTFCRGYLTAVSQRFQNNAPLHILATSPLPVR